MNGKIFGVHVLTKEFGKCDALEIAKIACEGGASVFQYRPKTQSDEAVEQGKKIRELLHTYGRKRPTFIVNDSLEMAKEIGADGVHFGQEDWPKYGKDELNAVRHARKILGEKAIVGISASTLREAERASVSEADYIGAGAVFETATKPDAKILGLEGLKAMFLQPLGVAIVAIGGITPENMKEVSRHCHAIAVTSAVADSKDPVGTIKEFRKWFEFC